MLEPRACTDQKLFTTYATTHHYVPARKHTVLIQFLSQTLVAPITPIPPDLEDSDNLVCDALWSPGDSLLEKGRVGFEQLLEQLQALLGI